MVRIDFMRAGKYQSKEWDKMKNLYETNMGKVTYYRSAGASEPYEVKRKRLYVGGEPVYKWYGWGMGAGETFYMVGRQKYKRPLSMDKFQMKRLQDMMSPFNIPLDKLNQRPR